MFLVRCVLSLTKASSILLCSEASATTMALMQETRFVNPTTLNLHVPHLDGLKKTASPWNIQVFTTLNTVERKIRRQALRDILVERSSRCSLPPLSSKRQSNSTQLVPCKYWPEPSRLGILVPHCRPRRKCQIWKNKYPSPGKRLSPGHLRDGNLVQVPALQTGRHGLVMSADFLIHLLCLAFFAARSLKNRNTAMM